MNENIDILMAIHKNAEEIEENITEPKIKEYIKERNEQFGFEKSPAAQLCETEEEKKQVYELLKNWKEFKDR